MAVAVTSFNLPFSKRSVRAVRVDASVPGIGGGAMPSRRIARRSGPLGESSAAKSQTHAAMRPPGRATRRISDIARALMGTKLRTSEDATTSKDLSGDGNSARRRAGTLLSFARRRCERGQSVIGRVDRDDRYGSARHRDQPREYPGADRHRANPPPWWSQPGEKGLADRATPAPHELLVGPAVIEAVCRHGGSPRRATAAAAARWLSASRHSLHFQSRCFH